MTRKDDARPATPSDRDQTDTGRSDDAYEVGYGKPPKHTRFVKGQSGNPFGRPPKAKPRPLKLSDAPFESFLEQEAYRTVTLRENGEKIELPAAQAAMRALVTDAIKGKRLSQKHLFEQLDRVERENLDRKVEHYVSYKDLKEKGEKVLADCARRGVTPPEFYPHPDDIVLKSATGEVVVNGPTSKEEARHYEHSAELRDHLLMRFAYADRTDKGPKLRTDDGPLCLFGVLAHLMDWILPARYRWGEDEAMAHIRTYQSLTKRALKARIKEDYARLTREAPPPVLLTPELKRSAERIGDVLAGPRHKEK